jgi:4-diphosphocytidyl-2-C-methyl-D-erythritol kinase
MNAGAPDALCLPARAKLNLVLRTVGRRADGYHLLETLFHEIDLHDSLAARRAPHGIGLEVTADDARDLVAGSADNLVVRAAAAFAARAAVAHGFAFRLHKRIPHGAGLGGGSSDAAAALRLCNQLCGSPLDRESLHGLARALGADCAFFLEGGSQWGRGIGDELQPARTVPPRWFLLIVPPFACPTADVYKKHAELWRDGGPIDTLPVGSHRTIEDSDLRRFENDLEEAAEQVRPELAQLRARVMDDFPSVRMTGSGSCLFVAFDRQEDASGALAKLAPLAARGNRLLGARSAARADAESATPCSFGGLSPDSGPDGHTDLEY